MKSDSRTWFIDDDLKTRPIKFWKYMSTLRKNIFTSIKLHVAGTYTDDPGDVAETLAKHFYTA
jgi:hypothetical protein